ncbi:hypothetical protein SUDANB105_07924 [Streptomyces sp. enrichment culture]
MCARAGAGGGFPRHRHGAGTAVLNPALTAAAADRFDNDAAGRAATLITARQSLTALLRRRSWRCRPCGGAGGATFGRSPRSRPCWRCTSCCAAVSGGRPKRRRRPPRAPTRPRRGPATWSPSGFWGCCRAWFRWLSGMGNTRATASQEPPRTADEQEDSGTDSHGHGSGHAVVSVRTVRRGLRRRCRHRGSRLLRSGGRRLRGCPSCRCTPRQAADPPRSRFTVTGPGAALTVPGPRRARMPTSNRLLPQPPPPSRPRPAGGRLRSVRHWQW